MAAKICFGDFSRGDCVCGNFGRMLERGIGRDAGWNLSDYDYRGGDDDFGGDNGGYCEPSGDGDVDRAADAAVGCRGWRCYGGGIRER